MLLIKNSEDKYCSCLSCGSKDKVLKLVIGLDPNITTTVNLCYDCLTKELDVYNKGEGK
jgi:hypothetical protein